MMMRILVFALAPLAYGKDLLKVLFENIGRLPVALDLVADSTVKRLVIINPGQGGKLNTIRGQVYRFSATDHKIASVSIQNEGHVRCWAAEDERQVKVYSLWGSEIFKSDSIVEPDASIFRQDKFEVVFENRGRMTVMLKLLLASGVQQHRGSILARKGKKVRAYWGQVFELHSESDPMDAVTVAVEGKGSVRSHDSQGRLQLNSSWIPVEKSGFLKSWLAHTSTSRDLCEINHANHSEDIARFCDGKFSVRMHVWDTYVKSHPGKMMDRWNKERNAEAELRLQRVQSQPRQFKKMTTLGHAVRDVPADVLQQLQDFWQKQRLSKSEPESHGAEVLAGSDTWMLYVPDDVLDSIHKRLLPVVAQWAGLSSGQLVPINAYGMRLYRNGSSLRMHVDSSLRAALSVILQVGHLDFASEGNVLSYWPLQILDHDGATHLVPNRVGQMILYESATCAHGRPSAFTGREFANVFLHYNPIDWPEAYVIPGTQDKHDEL